jgi:chemotaxis protein CheX
MDQKTIVASVSKAARDVFSTMLGMEIEVGESFIEQTSPPESQKVVALIGLAGQWIGTGVVGCSPEFACRIASTMLMAEYEAVNEDVLDAMAEMANMIFGNVKTELEESLGGLGLSIPTVIFGRNFATRSVGQQAWTVFPLKAGDDEMELKFCLMPNRDLQLHSRPGRAHSPLAVENVEA